MHANKNDTQVYYLQYYSIYMFLDSWLPVLRCFLYNIFVPDKNVLLWISFILRNNQKVLNPGFFLFWGIKLHMVGISLFEEHKTKQLDTRQGLGAG